MVLSTYSVFPKKQTALLPSGKALALHAGFECFESFLPCMFAFAPAAEPPEKPGRCRSGARDRTATLYFNGERLYWQEEGNAASWAACSGSKEVVVKKNYLETQRQADTGPIPEGCYLAPQQRFQQRPSDWVTALLGVFKRGAWPGGKKSWGSYRIWLEPENGTETFGRKGFTIHGEASPGSRGCIGLLENMDTFVMRFREYGKDMRLYVKYQ